MQSLINNSLAVSVILSAMIFYGVANAGATLCGPQEETYFSCKTNSGKLVSLCEAIGSNQRKSMIYRFGKKNKIELFFSSDGSGDAKFLFNHYIRSKVDYLAIGFKNNGYKYRIFRNYDEEVKGLTDFGVTVEDVFHSGEEKVMPCAVVGVDRLSEAARSLQCDPESALGCADIAPIKLTPPEKKAR